MAIWVVPPDPPITENWKVDWLGAFAVGAGLVLILLGLTTAQNSSRGWQTPCEWHYRFVRSLTADIRGLFAGAAVLFGLFAWRQWRLTKLYRLGSTASTPPLIPADLLSWEKRNLLVIYVAAFCIWGASDVSLSSRLSRDAR